MKLHHVGYLVRSIDRASEEILNSIQEYYKTKTVYDKEQDAFIEFIWFEDSQGYSCLELVQPGNNNQKLIGLVNKNGDHLYHICYETENFDVEYENMIKKGAIVIKDKKKAIALNNKTVAFFYLRKGLIIELLQK